MRLAAAALLVMMTRALPGGAALEVAADRTRVTVGDRVTLTVRARLPEGAALLDRAPRAAEPLPDGVRIISADTLIPARDGALAGTVRVVLLRPGPRQLPVLALAYRRGASARADTLLGPRVAVEVVSVLPPGNPALRDIKDIERSPAALWLRYGGVALGGVLALLVAYLVVRRRVRRRAEAEAVVAPPAPAPPSPYEVALERLAEIEAARLLERGDVALHYALTADTLRRYLEEAHEVPALERTTAELLWTLPPALSGAALRAECGALLEDADLVKFARLRPSTHAAAAFLRRSRALVESWHMASSPEPSEAVADALR